LAKFVDYFLNELGISETIFSVAGNPFEEAIEKVCL